MINIFRDFGWIFLSLLPQTVLMRRNGEVKCTRVLAECTNSILITYVDTIMYVPLQLEFPYTVTMWIPKTDPRIVSDVVTDTNNIIPFPTRKRINAL